MTTTDTDALEEQIDDAIRAIEDGVAGYEVLLGIIAVEVRAAKAEAWHHGFQEGYCLEPRPDWANALSNPYREMGGSDERR